MIDNREGPHYDVITTVTLNNMRPHVGDKSSMFGFLGVHEDYTQRVKEDSQVLQNLGVTYAQLSDSLSNILSGSNDSTHKTQNGIYVTASDSRGSQTCPYEDCKAEASFDYTAQHENNGMKWEHLSKLHPHLIGEHHFFEGRGSMYRLEPINAILLSGVPVDRESLIHESLNQLRSLTAEHGIHLSEAHNLFIVCQDEAELPEILGAYMNTIPDSDYKANQLIEIIEFLRYKSDTNKETFVPLVEKIEQSVANWSRENRLKLSAIQRVLSNDVDYPTVANYFLPDVISTLPKSQQAYLEHYVGRHDITFTTVLDEGRDYWSIAYEERAKDRLDHLDRSGIIRERFHMRTKPERLLNLFDKSRPVTEIPAEATNIEALKRIFDNEYPDSFEKALSSTNHSGELFSDIEEQLPYGNHNYGRYYQSGGIYNFEEYIEPSQSAIDKLSSEQLTERLKFYQWGERFASAVGNLKLLGYCCMQQALVFEKQSLSQDAVNKRQQMDEVIQLIESK